MIGSVFVLTFLFLIIYVGKLYQTFAIRNVKIYRKFSQNKVEIGTNLYMDLVIENCQKHMAPFIYVEQEIPNKLYEENTGVEDTGHQVKNLRCMLLGERRLVDRLHLEATQRGTFVFKNMTCGFGDFFGFYYQEEDSLDFQELLVLPQYKDLEEYHFQETSDLGRIFANRWLNPDNMFIRSVREYGFGDSFKDIHWKQTAKNQKLMAKVYDYTQEASWMLLLNLQCSKEHFDSVSFRKVEEAISLCAAIGNKMEEKGLPFGYMTNGRLLSIHDNLSGVLKPNTGNFEALLEYLSRTDYYLKSSFADYMKEHYEEFDRTQHYVIISLYQDPKVNQLLEQLAQEGVHITLIQCFNQMTQSDCIEVYTYNWEELYDEL